MFLAMRKAARLRREAEEASATAKKTAADLVETHNVLQRNVAELAKQVELVNNKVEGAKLLRGGIR